jgi:arylsulfatase A-like enzyme
MTPMTDPSARPEQASQRQPNVLLVLCDQLRADHLGFGGNSVVQTPHLDALATRGLRCDRAYVSNPVCMPNRSTILTGRTPSAHGTRFNGIALDWSANTFVRELKRNGYRTGLVGKAHVQNIMSRADAVARWYDLNRREGVELPFPPLWDRWEDENRHREERVEMPDDYYGFGHVELAINHADYVSGHYYQWLIEQGVTEPLTVTGPRNGAEISPLWWQIYRPNLPAELYPTWWVGERSIDYIERAATGGQPWFLQVSFPDPHHPFTPPGRYWDMYDPADVALPSTFDVDPDQLMPHLQQWRANRGRQPSRMSPWAPDEKQFREAAAKEYGAITMIDDVLGRVFDALERTGQAEDTMVIFTSDHGDMFGDQGILLKACMHYEGCVRVPLVWAGPGVTPGVTDSLCGSIDIASTVLASAGVATYEGIQGHDLTPVLAAPEAQVRDYCLVEEDQPFDLLDLGSKTSVRSVVTSSGRLTRYRGSSRGELYDLDDDPEESANRWADTGADKLWDELQDALFEAMVSHTDQSRRPTAMG